MCEIEIESRQPQAQQAFVDTSSDAWEKQKTRDKND